MILAIVRPTLKRRGTAGIVAAVAAAGLALAGPAGASAPIVSLGSGGTAPVAGKSAETLVSYLTKGKLKLGKRVSYRMVCSQDCQVTVTSDLAVKGTIVPPLSSTGSFLAGQTIIATLDMTKGLRSDIAANIGSAKLAGTVKATATATGESDTDNRTFKFKRGGRKKK